MNPQYTEVHQTARIQVSNRRNNASKEDPSPLIYIYLNHAHSALVQSKVDSGKLFPSDAIAAQ